MQDRIELPVAQVIIDIILLMKIEGIVMGECQWHHYKENGVNFPQIMCMFHVCFWSSDDPMDCE